MILLLLRWRWSMTSRRPRKSTQKVCRQSEFFCRTTARICRRTHALHVKTLELLFLIRAYSVEQIPYFLASVLGKVLNTEDSLNRVCRQCTRVSCRHPFFNVGAHSLWLLQSSLIGKIHFFGLPASFLECRQFTAHSDGPNSHFRMSTIQFLDLFLECFYYVYD